MAVFETIGKFVLKVVTAVNVLRGEEKCNEREYSKINVRVGAGQQGVPCSPAGKCGNIVMDSR